MRQAMPVWLVGYFCFAATEAEVLRHVAPAEWRRLQAYFDGG